MPVTNPDSYTPLPWKVMKGIEDDAERCIIVSAGPTPFHIATIENGQPGDCCDTEEKTAHRIVDCVTALAGLNPEAVKDVVKALEAIAQQTELRRIPCNDPQCGDSTWDHHCSARSEKRPTFAALLAQDALAKLKEVQP